MSDSATRFGVVLSGTGGVWRVHDLQSNEIVEAAMRGRLKQERYGRRADGSIRRDTVAAGEERLKLAVGDRVTLACDPQGNAWTIETIEPRRSRLARRAPGGGHGERIVAANVDQVVIVFAAAKPEPHARMLDRFLVIAEANALAARIVVNKVELVGDSSARERFGIYERAGYVVHYTSVKQQLGLAPLHDALAGRESVFTGPSGVGKSSLLNALFPGANLRVGEISESVNKGRHTTVGARLLPLPGANGWVVDTPGLREVGMWDLPAERLDDCFREFRPFTHECRFADCSHVAEPECAVRDAMERGEIGRARYESYVSLLNEL